MRLWNTDDSAGWTCEYVDIKYLHNSKTAQLVILPHFASSLDPRHVSSFPVGVDLQKTESRSPSYIDLEADIGRIVLPLPGPREDAAYPTYRVVLATDSAIDAGTSSWTIQLQGEKNQSKALPLDEPSQIDSSVKEVQNEYLLYGIPSLGHVSDGECCDS